MEANDITDDAARFKQAHRELVAVALIAHIRRTNARNIRDLVNLSVTGVQVEVTFGNHQLVVNGTGIDGGGRTRRFTFIEERLNLGEIVALYAFG